MSEPPDLCCIGCLRNPCNQEIELTEQEHLELSIDVIRAENISINPDLPSMETIEQAKKRVAQVPEKPELPRLQGIT